MEPNKNKFVDIQKEKIVTLVANINMLKHLRLPSASPSCSFTSHLSALCPDSCRNPRSRSAYHPRLFSPITPPGACQDPKAEIQLTRAWSSARVGAPRSRQICEIRTDTAAPSPGYGDRPEPLRSSCVPSHLRRAAAGLLKMVVVGTRWMPPGSVGGRGSWAATWCGRRRRGLCSWWSAEMQRNGVLECSVCHSRLVVPSPRSVSRAYDKHRSKISSKFRARNVLLVVGDCILVGLQVSLTFESSRVVRSMYRWNVLVHKQCNEYEFGNVTWCHLL
jgi:hypothetical protein